MIRTPVLEIGGTHVTAAVVTFDPGSSARASVTDCCRGAIPAQGTAAQIGAAIGAVVGSVDLRTSAARWGIAIPGPFDYERGVGLFTAVGKFDSLYGVDLADLLAEHAGITDCRFVNDAEAFGLGEYAVGAGRGYDPSVYLTLGTGVGSAFIHDGVCRRTGADVPPEGHAHLIDVDGVPLEDRMSRRAIMADWSRRTGESADVRQIAERARSGDGAATAVFREAYGVLALGLAPYLVAFGARAVIIGGSVARSWDLVERHLITALAGLGCDMPVLPAADPESSPLVGASWVARD